MLRRVRAASFHFWLFKIAHNYLCNFVRDRDGFEDFTDRACKDSESGTFWARGNFEPNPEVKLTLSETVDRRQLILRKLLSTAAANADGHLAVKAKLTCAGALLARGRRFPIARRTEKTVRQAIALIDEGRRDDIRPKVVEGRNLLRAYLDRNLRRPEPCQPPVPTASSRPRYASAR